MACKVSNSLRELPTDCANLFQVSTKISSLLTIVVEPAWALVCACRARSVNSFCIRSKIWVPKICCKISCLSSEDARRKREKAPWGKITVCKNWDLVSGRIRVANSSLTVRGCEAIASPGSASSLLRRHRLAWAGCEVVPDPRCLGRSYLGVRQIRYSCPRASKSSCTQLIWSSPA